MSIINNYTEQEMSISNKSYTNKDFNNIYPELLDLVKKLTNKWDPTTSNESDPGVVLLKLWSILADKLNYNIDKNILEAFPLSVTLRANAQRLYDMLGYDLRYYRSAVTSVNIYYTGSDLGSTDEGKVETITIPKWTMLTNDSGDINYTLAESLVLGIVNLTQPVKVIQGTIMNYEVNGVADITLDNLDSENRLFFTESLIAENGIFIDNKGNGENTSESGWQQVSNLESQDLGQKVFKFGVLPNTNTCFILFPQDIANLIGNGLNIKYLITAGAAGNVKANELTTLVSDLIPIEFLNSENTELNNKSINSSLIIKNVNATVNGADPEDLDSAYKNYKKTVGTFETLVTNKDYENAIYMLADTYGIPLVSNVVVADRTSDINTSTQVITLSGDSNTSELVVDNILKEVPAVLPKNTIIEDSHTTSEDITVTVKVLEPKLSAFDVCLYVLEPMVDIFNDSYFYNRSFSVHSNITNIRNNIEDKKSACHDYAETYLDEEGKVNRVVPYIFKNFYTLTGKVATYYKVSDKEADEIEDNIKAALYKAFNARNVEFGEPVKFDDILLVVELADTRIKTVILNEPEYTFKYLKADDYLGTFDSAVSLPTDNVDATKGVTRDATIALLYLLLAKMIVSGHVLLYNFNRDIEFEFGQTQIVKHSNIKKITTESKIEEARNNVTLDGLKVTEASFINNTESLANNKGYKIQPNENIQLYAPNFYTKTAYTAYVNYRFGSDPASVTKAEGNGDGEHQLNKVQVYKSNQYYKLTAPIYLRYIDENSITHKLDLPEGTLVRFVDDNDTSAEFKMVPEECVSYDGVKYMALGASQKLEIIDVNKTTFKDSGWVKCLWFTNKTTSLDNGLVEYELFAKDKTEYILQDNEYFMYTNKELNELVILGSGTMLRRLGNDDNALTCRCNIKANSVIENGLSAISDTTWKNLNTNSVSGDPFEIVELLIVTLGEGAGVRFNTLTLNDKPSSTDVVTLISNEPHKVSGGLYCENFKESLDTGEQNTWVNLAVYDESLQEDSTGLYLGWSVVSRANLLTSPSVAQTLNSNTTVKVYEDLSDTPTVISAGHEIHTTALLAIAGGEDLELSSSNNQEINFYESVPEPWPTYYTLDGNGEIASFKRDEKTGFIPVKFTDITRLEDGSYASSGIKDFKFSFAPTAPSSTVTIQIPFTYTGSLETRVQISLFNNSSIVNGAQIINLSNSNTKDTLEYGGKLGSFTHIKVSFEATDPNKGSADLAKIIDTLYIGKIKILDSTGLAIYSDQVVETIRVFDDDEEELIITKINNKLLPIINEKYDIFDRTYIVPKKDLIDTSVNGSNNKNNLFGGNAIWDKNHICNKFTIPQLDTKYSSITIASSSLKEERK